MIPMSVGLESTALLQPLTPQERTFRVFSLVLVILNFAILMLVSIGNSVCCFAPKYHHHHQYILRMFVGVGGLGTFQLKIMLKGTTTVERKAFRWAQHDARESRQVIYIITVFCFVLFV
jgi:hypothetical protein